MERDQPRLRGDGVEQRGQIRETEDDFRIRGKRAVVDLVEDPHGPVAATQSEDGANPRIAGEAVEVRRSCLVTSGKVAILRMDVGPQLQPDTEHFG